MLQQTTIKFLSALEKNNDRQWFESHRAEYESAKENFLTFVEKLIPAIATFDPSVIDLVAKNCTFRINRDVRFSKNKAPYKNNMSAYFNKAGKKGPGAGYYLHIQPGASFAAAGIWQPEAAVLNKIRQEIDYNLDEWKKITNSNVFKKEFKNGMDQSDILVRPPKGYEEDNEAMPFLKLKSFVVRKSITDEDLFNKGFLKQVGTTFKATKPIVDFLNRAIDKR